MNNYRIELIETGDGYITREQYWREAYRGEGRFEGMKVEKTILTLDNDGLCDTLLRIKAQQERIKQLEKRILDFNAAHESLRV